MAIASLGVQHVQYTCSLADRYKEVDFVGHAGHKLWKVNYEAFLTEVEIGKTKLNTE